MFLQEEHELNEKFYSIQFTNLFKEKYISGNMCPFILCKEILPTYWLETQPINHNKELDAYTISVPSRSGYFRQFHF